MLNHVTMAIKKVVFAGNVNHAFPWTTHWLYLWKNTIWWMPNFDWALLGLILRVKSEMSVVTDILRKSLKLKWAHVWIPVSQFSLTMGIRILEMIKLHWTYNKMEWKWPPLKHNFKGGLSYSIWMYVKYYSGLNNIAAISF